MNWASARSSRASAPRRDDEAGTGQEGCTLEIHQAERLAELDMVLRRKIELRGRAGPAQLDIVGLVRTVRHVLTRRVRHAFKQHIQFRSRLALSLFSIPLLVLEPRDFRDQLIGRFAGRLGLADLAGERIAALAALLETGLADAAFGIECAHLRRDGRFPPPLQGPVERLRALPYPPEVQHPIAFRALPSASYL